MVRPTVPPRFKVAGDHADVSPVGQKQNQSWKTRPLLRGIALSRPRWTQFRQRAHFGRVAVLLATIAIIVALVESLTIPVARSNPRPVALASQIQSPSDLDSAAFSLSADGAGWEASAARSGDRGRWRPDVRFADLSAEHAYRRDGRNARSSRLLACGGGRRRVLLRGRPVLRIDGWHPPQSAHCGNGAEPRRPGLLVGGGGWWRVLLRGRPVLRIDGQHPPQSAHRRHHSDAQRARLLDGRIGRRHLQPRGRRLLRVPGGNPPERTHRRFGLHP